MSSDKQPLMGQPSAPPPYGFAHPPPYPNPPHPQPAYYGPPPSHYGTTIAGGGQTTVTVVQGQPIRSQVFVELKPPNYVIMSVITMLFFCFIFGLIALLLSLQVDSSWVAGDREGARRHSAAARGWNVAGMVVGVVVYVCAVVAIVATAATGAYSYSY